METWGFAISVAICRPGNRSEYMEYVGWQGWQIRGAACSRLWPSGPGYADPSPVLCLWQFAL